VSELRANTISDAAGTGPVTLTGQYAAKAWAKVTDAGAVTVGFNVSSVTDDGVGLFTVSYTSAMASADYGTYGMTNGLLSSDNAVIQNEAAPTASATQYGTGYGRFNTKSDTGFSSVSAHGDLA
jgi:hypothetical protein